MFARGKSAKHVSRPSKAAESILLPFLYHTRTIHSHASMKQQATDPDFQNRAATPSSNDGIRYVTSSNRRDHNLVSKARREKAMDTHVRQQRKEKRERWKADREDVESMLDQDEVFPKPRGGYVPFEGMAERDEDWRELEGTTITPNEAKAFQGLFDLQKEREEGRKEGGAELQSAQKSGSLPTSGPETGVTSRLDTSAFSPALRRMAEKSQKQREEAREKRNQQKRMRTREQYQASLPPSTVIGREGAHELSSVRAEMEEADTDVKLWEILWTRVLNRVVAATQPKKREEKKEAKKKSKKPKKQEENVIDVENVNAPATDSTEPSAKLDTSSDSQTTLLTIGTDQTPNDLALLTTTLPTHLLNAFRQLTNHYPGSPLALTLLPTLKSLGPSAFALGASTTLYNLHMSVHYSAYHDLDFLLTQLTEMEREVYDFNLGTLRMIDRVLGERWSSITRLKEDWQARGAEQAKSSPSGVEVVWGMDRQQHGLKALKKWRGRVRERIEMQAVRRARALEGRREDGVQEEALREEKGREREEMERQMEEEWVEEAQERLRREELIKDITESSGRDSRERGGKGRYLEDL